MGTICGCDPGLSGALAWVDDEGYLIDAIDMPVVRVREKNKISASALASIMSRHPIDRVTIEGVGAMPRMGTKGPAAMGTTSAFNFGYGAGLLEGVATGLGLPVEIIPAAVWKRKAGVPADKGAVLEMAQRQWLSDKFRRKKDDGRADAALLARWAATRTS
jgi:hypothetical protein